MIGRGLRLLAEVTADTAALARPVTLLDASTAGLERTKAHRALAAIG